MKSYLKKLCKYKGRHRGIQEAQKHISCYVKDIFDASKIRQSIFKAENYSEMINIIKFISNEI